MCGQFNLGRGWLVGHGEKLIGDIEFGVEFEIYENK